MSVNIKNPPGINEVLNVDDTIVAKTANQVLLYAKNIGGYEIAKIETVGSGDGYGRISVLGNTGTAVVSLIANTNSSINRQDALVCGSTTLNASAIFQCVSTTKGIAFPAMTAAQKNAIGTPTAGLVVFDTDAGKLCVYNGAAWRTITDS